MTFIHPLLLSGIVLVGLPVVLHLIMRQQPKHLIFPAFRFLQLRQRTNQRKLRLRHLVLLALRMLLIALMCLALARPKLFSDRFGFLGDDPAATVVLVVDTSPSMGYTVAGKSRLDDAKARALELLEDVGESSRIAVLDTGEPTPEWAISRAAARERIANLALRPANRPVTDALDVAFRLLGSTEIQEPGDDTRPRFVYVFSDRTPASWENSRVGDLKTRRDKLPDPKPRLVYVDVGVDKPVDAAVADVVVKPQAVPANRPVTLQVTVQNTGQDSEWELSCGFDGETAEKKPIRLKAGERRVVIFEKRGLKTGFHQAKVLLQPDDNLPANDTRYATVLVREPRKVLVLCDEPTSAYVWRTAINKQGLYQCDVMSVHDAEFIRLAPQDLATYQAICLVDVAAPGPELWVKLNAYVLGGGGLAVAIGGAETQRESYNRDDSAGRGLMPAELERYEVSPAGVGLSDYQYQHPLMAKFREWQAEPNDLAHFNSRRAFQYWIVKPAGGATVLLRYDDKEKSPALVERTLAESGGRSRVLLFTTPMDNRLDALGHPANNWNSASWYYFVLVNEAVRYLAGEAEDAVLNYTAGPPVTIPLPLAPRFPSYTLAGPGLTGADTHVERAESAGELRLTQPQQPGHYVLSAGRDWSTRFSVNVAPEECLLLPRVNTDVIEEVFGSDSVVQVGQTKRLKDALEGQFRQPVELFPWLMILLLFALAVENLLANKFYQRRAGPQTEGQ